MKRFYRLVTSVQDGEGYLIHLDGKPVRTPSGRPLTAPNADLSAHVVQEWTAQGDSILPDTMPLTQILTTAQDREGEDRAAIEVSVLAYLDTDLLCYRTAAPDAIATRQSEEWNKWLQDFAEKSGVMLETTTNIVALKQPDAAHDFVRGVLTQADRWTFTAIQMVTAATGSLILALAFVAGRASPDDVFKASQVEELYRSALYNEDFYGRDPHQEKAQTALMRDLNTLRLFLDTLPG